MSKEKPVGSKLAALNAVRDDLQSPHAHKLLRESLHDRSNHVIGRAADLIGETEDNSFVEDLLKAYDRLMEDPLKTDPGCLGKTAIVRTLVALQYDVAEFYRRGIEYQQLEPIWSTSNDPADKSKDTASELRGTCAAGLVLCASGLEVLNRCAVLLTDRWDDARLGAARAIGMLRQAEGAPLMRLKLLTGDKNPEVIGECCASLLRLDRDEGVPFVVQFLRSLHAEVCVQAALALGASRLPGTFEPLRQAWEHQREPAVRESLLICIGLLRSTEASDFLLSLIESNRFGAAPDAIKALKAFGKSGELRQRIAAAVNTTGNERLKRLSEKEWGEFREAGA
jgi:HEAT repeat protein